MNKFFFTLMLCAAPLVRMAAQLVLEKTYDFPAQRYLVEGLGERYARAPYLKSDIWTVEFYKGDHTLSHSVGLRISSKDQNALVSNPSAYYFDNDPGIEFAIRRDRADDNFTPSVSFYDDNGARIGPEFPFFVPDMVTLADGKRKIIYIDTVYAVPGIVKERVFETQTGLKHIRLEKDGDKYYAISKTGDVVFYNTDYTVFKTFKVGLTGQTAANIDVLGQYQINGDDAIEWGVTSSLDAFTNVRYYSDEKLLSEHKIAARFFSYEQATLLPKNWPDLTRAKSVLRNTGASGPAAARFSVADVLTGAVELQRTGSFRFGNVVPEGLKYWNSVFETSDTFATVYNPNYTVWAKFPFNPLDFRLLEPSTNVYDNDSATKEFLVERFILPSIYLFYDEKGKELFRSPTCTTGVVSRLPNLPNKFLAIGPSRTNVYAMPSTGPVSGVSALPGAPTLSISAYPNPFFDVLQLDLGQIKSGMVQVSVFDAYGRMVGATTALPSGSIQPLAGVSALQSGFYWIRVDQGDAYGWIKVVKN